MLTTTAITDPDLDRAIGELLHNVCRLAVAGHADIAIEALTLLQADGPWHLPRYGGVRTRYERMIAPISLLARVDCPATSENSAMSLKVLSEWAETKADDELNWLAVAGRIQTQPAGIGWSDNFLDTLANRVESSASQPHRHFGGFSADADLVLKARLAKRFCRGVGMETSTSDELKLLGIDLAAFMTASSEIALEAEQIDTLAIIQAIARYLETTGFQGGHLEPIYSIAWLLMIDEGREQAALEVATAWLRQCPDACQRMVDLSVVPSANAFVRVGKLAAALGISRRDAVAWAERLKERPRHQTELPPMTQPGAQTDTHAELLAALDGSTLALLHWTQIAVPETDEHAWAAVVPVAMRLETWKVARGLIDRTGRWPLVCASGANEIDPEELSDELFSRWPYTQGASTEDVTPQALVAAAQSVDLADFLQRLDRESLAPSEWLEVWRAELEHLGVSTDGFDEAWESCGQDPLAFESWLADREQSFGVTDPERGRQPVFDPDNALLLLLPTRCSAHALAYVHWYGMERGRPEAYIRLLESWHERFGAELYAHYGTMLEFNVQRPPADFATALGLAQEHLRVAPSTLYLPGIALRHYALGLMDHRTWFLHERP